jgi:hypothetical protein
MKSLIRGTGLGAITLVLLALGTTTASAQPNKCLAGKIKCISKMKSCLLASEAKARNQGQPIDLIKLQKCEDKFDYLGDGCFGKLEAQNDGPCLTVGDAPNIGALVQAVVADLAFQLDPNPADDQNACTAGKLKCARLEAKCLLKVEAKAAKLGLFPDPIKIQKCKDKFAYLGTGCFEKIEAMGGCLTNGDAGNIEQTIDAFVADVVDQLTP